MTIQDLIKSPIIQQCIENSKAAEILKKDAAYNLFTLSRHNSQKENFHSHVIASLFNPKALHNEGNKFLYLFLDYLNTQYGCGIDKTKYENTTEELIYLEIGDSKSRIDILIKGEGRCVLVENKMNNAPDMDKQIDRYYELLKHKNLEVDAIIYLTLDGVKNAPTPENPSAKEILKSIGAFTNQSDDLVNGWLVPCLNNTTNDNSNSLIYQYIKLVKHLNSSALEVQSLESFYQLVKTQEILNTAIEIKENSEPYNTIEELNSAIKIKELLNKLPIYRIKKIIHKVENHRPFKNNHRYSNYNSWIYETYNKENDTIKLQLKVDCNPDSSIAIHIFHLDKPRDYEGHKIIANIMEAAKIIDFEPFEFNHGFKKVFALLENNTLQEIDEEVAIYLNDLFAKLRE